MEIAFLLVLTLFCIHTMAEDPTSEDFTKKWTAGENEIIYVESLLNFNLINDAQDFTFVTCQNSQDPRRADCQIHAESPKSLGKICPFQITARPQHYLKIYDWGEELKVKSLSKDKIIVPWSEGEDVEDSWGADPKFMHLSIIDMSNCSITHVLFPANLTFENWSGWIFSQDKIDAVFSNTSLCNNLDFCKVTYDLQGNVIGDPKPFSSNNSKFFGKYVSISPTNEGLVTDGVFKSDVSLNQITYIDSDGTERILSRRGPMKSRYSVGFGKFVECNLHVGGVQLHCFQSQLGSNDKIEFAVRPEKKISDFDVINMAGIGFLVGIAQCNVTLKTIQSNNSLALTTYTCTNFMLTEVINENVSKTIEFPLNFKCTKFDSIPFSVKIVQAEEKFCIRFICFEADEDSEAVTLHVKCVTKNQIEFHTF